MFAESPAELRLQATTFAQNRINVMAGRGSGGAAHLESGVASVNDSEVYGNVAHMSSSTVAAEDATAGGFSVAANAKLIVGKSLFYSNRAGGIGRAESLGSAFSSTVASNQNVRAAHVSCEGLIVLEESNITLKKPEPVHDPDGGEAHAAAWLFVGKTTGKIALVNCHARGGSELDSDQPTGLLNLVGQAEALLRGCDVHDLAISSSIRADAIGIVNSTFDPPLDDSVQAIAPPNCALSIAGQPRLCDPRANCVNLSSGGVQCECVGAGLRSKPGVPEDGRQCLQDPSLRTVLESESVTITVAKPGSLTSRTLTLIVEALGEAELSATFSVSMTRKEASSQGALLIANRSIRVDQPSMSAFGLHLEWKLPPAPTWRADLDGSQLKFAHTSRHEFTVRLECVRGEQSCAADGDDITTIVQLASPQDGRLKSEVRVLTQVQSLLSCLHTRATTRIEPDSASVPISTPIHVHLFATDVDNQPVNFTRAEISLRFGGKHIPMQWSRGSNKYMANVTGEFTAQPGVYDLVLSASNTWSKTGPATSCVLLRRTITVEEGLNTNYILAGAGGAAVMVTGTMIVVVRKRHAHLQAIMVMIFTEVRRPSAVVSPPVDRPHASLELVPVHVVSTSQPLSSFQNTTTCIDRATQCVAGDYLSVRISTHVLATGDGVGGLGVHGASRSHHRCSHLHSTA